MKRLQEGGQMSLSSGQGSLSLLGLISIVVTLGQTWIVAFGLVEEVKTDGPGALLGPQWGGQCAELWMWVR